MLLSVKKWGLSLAPGLDLISEGIGGGGGKTI